MSVSTTVPGRMLPEGSVSPWFCATCTPARNPTRSNDNKRNPRLQGIAEVHDPVYLTASVLKREGALNKHV
eukprot:3247493-Pyramimonas_sp.AAC.3